MKNRTDVMRYNVITDVMTSLALSPAGSLYKWDPFTLMSFFFWSAGLGTRFLCEFKCCACAFKDGTQQSDGVLCWV